MLVLQAPSTSTRGLIFGVMVLAQAAVFRTSIALPHAEQLRNVNGGITIASSRTRFVPVPAIFLLASKTLFLKGMSIEIKSAISTSS
jgi:hypothetical protein